MAELPKGTVLKNTFLTTETAKLPMRRVLTMGAIVSDSDLGKAVPETEVIPRPKPKIPLSPKIEVSSSEESSEETGSTTTIAWISFDAFRDISGKERLDQLGKVKCYKTAEKFFRTFSKKYAVRPESCGKNIVLLVHEGEKESLLGYIKSMSGGTFKGILDYVDLDTSLPKLTHLMN